MRKRKHTLIKIIAAVTSGIILTCFHTRVGGMG